MKNHASILKWATDCLSSKGYSQQHLPELMLETPWSNVFRFPTAKGCVYLKQPAPLLSQEAKIIRLLGEQFQASVPHIIAVNDDLHCFLMEDAGQNLRAYLKTEFNLEYLYQSIKQFTAIQRTTENAVELFLALDIPDWRLHKLPKLYNEIINKAAFLKTEGMTDEELQILQDLSPQIAEECELLSQYSIKSTIVQPDFNTNNILINPDTNELTFIDLGEIAITHPFFSLHNFLYTAIIHHGVKEGDRIYQKLQEACIENWLEFGTKKQLLKGFILAKKLWSIYSIIAHYHFMHCVDQEDLKVYYANRPNQLIQAFREYITF
ncbi:phosphotransferase [Fluoribacter dumoffii]|uniref:Predicted phosphotransferase related to Ser/Thr protein kinases n=1 Tax=Fluoribacter dumoffii TaxID=463 RepID=A0A377GAC9_9GAMM|nr:phosphotransferase [Fluoribacter dumoffii]KTC90331.1 hypothetical protein Ldum_1399 [Fluoribacter dumoffii NY 23]STO21451.1 Predicted phosphotransferase related to Ser/Thr protein kinases [Fluoribacter dumoffii]